MLTCLVAYGLSRQCQQPEDSRGNNLVEKEWQLSVQEDFFSFRSAVACFGSLMVQTPTKLRNDCGVEWLQAMLE